MQTKESLLANVKRSLKEKNRFKLGWFKSIKVEKNSDDDNFTIFLTTKNFSRFLIRDLDRVMKLYKNNGYRVKISHEKT